MNVLFDHEQLFHLVTNLYTLIGIRANIMDRHGLTVYSSLDRAAFCQRMNDLPAGHRRCLDCDARMADCCAAGEGLQHYRCHAGVCEAILPIRTDRASQPMAYLIVGQFLDDSPLEEQWEQARSALEWWPGDPEELRQSFFQFRQYSGRELNAYCEIIETLAAYISLKGMISPVEHSDLQKLKLFLDQHYMEKLSLASVSAQLHIGRTKLCMLAKQLSGGQTLTQMIARRRVDTAKTLLLQSSLPISAVAESVGISDYNYFSKVFRAVEGTTPSDFRRKGRQAAESGN